ncbi:MAG: TetR/AcrR family transcriptional regulator [Verrucomicrobiota bacterium]
MNQKEQQILDAAEKMVRAGGYHTFSFRDIANEVGIKSSSVHYHFSTKGELGAAVAKRYTDTFFELLGDPEALLRSGKEPLEVYVGAFEQALIRDKRMCLCGLLGAEADGLPPEVADQAKVFFERNIEWLTRAYSLGGKPNDARDSAIQTLSLLEGAMITSIVVRDIEVFKSVSKGIRFR